MAEEAVIALHGPRTVGKSTLLDDVARDSGRVRLDLDDPTTLGAVTSDPTLFVQGPSPVCVDEYQRAPVLLDAIKAELSNDFRPGRFVLTGSTTYASLPLDAQSLTGRLHLIQVWPLSQGEIAEAHETFVEQLIADPSSLISPAPSATSREEYAERIIRGGMPLALRRPTTAARNRWFDDYVALVVERDVMDLSRVRQREALPRLLRQLAAQTGGLLSIAKAARQAGIEQSTAESYTKLLEAAFLVHRLPAWGRTLRSRIGTSPKVHLVDSGLAARLHGVTTEKLALREPASLVEFGHLLETFVVDEVLKQAGWLEQRVTTGHLRTKDGLEVDLVVERDDGGVIGIEVKAGVDVDTRDFRGLRLLRTMTGERFIGGVVINLGRHAYTADDRMHVIPADRLWMA